MLGKSDILRGLASLDDKARAASVLVDLSTDGGAALAIAFDLRQATRDVDAVVDGSAAFLRKAVAEIASEQGWPEDWLNDGVKAFRSANERMVLMDGFQGGADGGLRVSLPTAEYLFAMKCMAMRPEGVEGSRDITDIASLVKICGLRTAKEALDLVAAFYPSARIPAKVAFGVQEIMERAAQQAAAEDGGVTNPASDEPG